VKKVVPEENIKRRAANGARRPRGVKEVEGRWSKRSSNWLLRKRKERELFSSFLLHSLKFQ